MSYDVYFDSDAGDDEVPFADEWKNYTSNVSQMWTEAIGQNLGDAIQSNPRPSDLLPIVERGIAAMQADPDKYRAMNPENGWGDYDGALGYLAWIAAACRYYPERKVRVSR